MRPDPREIHVWTVPLDPSPGQVAALEELLTDDERERAGRFHFDLHRRRFVVRRGALRSILGGVLGESPRRLRFEVGERGKPSIAGEADLCFNLTDSEDLALVGVCRGDELGVDVERLRTSRDLDGIAARFFAAAEQHALRRLPDPERVGGFFRIWTRKEAYLKAIGTGLHTPLDRFSVSLEADDARFLEIDGSRDEAAAWSIHHLEPMAGHVGAIAIRRRGDRVRWQTWEPPGAA